MTFLRKNIGTPGARNTGADRGVPDIAAPAEAVAPVPTDATHSRQTGVPTNLAGSKRDEEIWALANRVQGLYRSQSALREMLERTQQVLAKVVSVRPRVVTSDRAAVPVGPEPPNDPWWPIAPVPARAMLPPPGYCNFGTKTERAAVVACQVLGLRNRDLEAAVAAVVEELRGPGEFKPVFLTDSLDLGPIVREGFVAEFISPADWRDTATQDAEMPRQRLDALREKWGFSRIVDLRQLKARPLPVTLPGATAQPEPQPQQRGKRPKAAVVCWDLGHNPAGRAMVLHDLLERDYDVDIVGPIWSRFGQQVWAPIRNSTRKVRSFPCNRFEDFWPKAVALAADAEYDLVVVCKPQLPGLLLGAMIKKSCNCPLVLDIDDFELSFCANETPATLDELQAAGPDALSEPYLELAARACDGLVQDADARIVSNIALRRKYGGYIVRHARNEGVFDPDRFDRAAARAAMGIGDDDFAILFVGTLRRHKGVFEIARTLEIHKDKRLVLHLVGDIPDKRLRRELERFTRARVKFHPGCSFDELPERLVAADAVVLLQDPSHAISQYQIPAKVSDASALGLPLIATDVPPLRDLALQGLVRTIETRDLPRALDDLIAERDDGGALEVRQRLRECFLAELGFGVNRERLSAAIGQASRAGPGLPGGFERLISITTDAYRQIRSGAGAQPPMVPAKARGQFDVAMFWKQNNSGLYGRRSDMMMRHLLDSGRVRRVIQFDAPMTLGSLAQGVESGPADPASHILRNTVDNQFGLRDGDRHVMRTFLWDKRDRATILPGIASDLDAYPDHVAAQMARCGLRPETTLAWVCPVVFDFPKVAAHIPFRGIIGDLIDDQRRFAAREVHRERVTASYEETVPLFDLTFTNCAPMVEEFRRLAGDIHVVPNGTVLPTNDPGDAPAALRALDRPVAGYLGNLRDRFHWNLMREVALRLPHVSFAIVGGGARPEDAAKVADVSNIHLLGMVPHTQVDACIAAFDVALMPHERSPLTSLMNPLKIYNYFAARKPIVSTEVGNIDEALRPFIRFATDAESFARAVEDALKTPLETGPEYRHALTGILWDARVREVLSRLDTWLEKTAS